MPSLQDHAQSFSEGREFVFDMLEEFFDDPNFANGNFQHYVDNVINTYTNRTPYQRALDRQKRRDQRKALEELMSMDYDD